MQRAGCQHPKRAVARQQSFGPRRLARAGGKQDALRPQSLHPLRAGNFNRKIGPDGGDRMVEQDPRPGRFGSPGQTVRISCAIKQTMKLAQAKGRMTAQARHAAGVRCPLDHGHRANPGAGDGFGGGQPGRSGTDDQKTAHCGAAIGRASRPRVISSSAPRQLNP